LERLRIAHPELVPQDGGASVTVGIAGVSRHAGLDLADHPFLVNLAGRPLVEQGTRVQPDLAASGSSIFVPRFGGSGEGGGSRPAPA
jgi:hypothetical protein